MLATKSHYEDLDKTMEDISRTDSSVTTLTKLDDNFKVVGKYELHDGGGGMISVEEVNEAFANANPDELVKHLKQNEHFMNYIDCMPRLFFNFAFECYYAPPHMPGWWFVLHSAPEAYNKYVDNSNIFKFKDLFDKDTLNELKKQKYYDTILSCTITQSRIDILFKRPFGESKAKFEEKFRKLPTNVCSNPEDATYVLNKLKRYLSGKHRESYDPSEIYDGIVLSELERRADERRGQERMGYVLGGLLAIFCYSFFKALEK